MLDPGAELFRTGSENFGRCHYCCSPTGCDALYIAAEITTCLELLKKFDDRIKSYQKALGGRKGASWRKIGWSLFKANEVASFRQKICLIVLARTDDVSMIIQMPPLQPVLDLLPMRKNQGGA